MTVKLRNLTEIKSWILSFGLHAKVLEPAELVDLVRIDVESMCAAYRAK